ncbi:putative LRR containing protein, partial [Trachipleistophora hominis]
VNSAIEISSIGNSVNNHSKIVIDNFIFAEQVKLADNYERVELDYVFTRGDGEIVLNKSCKELLLRNCSIVVNAQDVENLESLEINFSIIEEYKHRLIGLKSVNHIYFTNVCRNVDSIVTILINIREVKHVRFETTHLFKTYIWSLRYCEVFWEHISAEYYGRSMNLDQIRLTAKNNPSRKFVDTLTNLLTNIILRRVLNEGGMSTVTKLEVMSTVIDENNCKMLKKLQNLNILRICSEHITCNFLRNLPTNLKLLDITDFIENDGLRSTKYTMKPSIIVQPHKNLEILVVEIQLLHNLSAISLLFPHLKVLKVRYSPLIDINPAVRRNKMRVRELLIESSDYQINMCKITNTKPEIIHFLRNLQFYVDFSLLECLALVSQSQSMILNPVTLQKQVFNQDI